jgi:hypothetical protein
MELQLPPHRTVWIVALLLLLMSLGHATVFAKGKNDSRGKDTPVRNGAPLSLQISPKAALAGTYVLARIRVHPDIDNRLLRISVESPTYFRSSDVRLDGANAAITHVVPLRALPAGSYAVVAIVYGTKGERARSLQRLELRSPHEGN